MNYSVAESQEIVNHAKSVVKCELHMSKLVCVCVRVSACAENKYPECPSSPHLSFSFCVPLKETQIKTRNLLTAVCEA